MIWHLFFTFVIFLIIQQKNCFNICFKKNFNKFHMIHMKKKFQNRSFGNKRAIKKSKKCENFQFWQMIELLQGNQFENQTNVLAQYVSNFVDAYFFFGISGDFGAFYELLVMDFFKIHEFCNVLKNFLQNFFSMMFFLIKKMFYHNIWFVKFLAIFNNFGIFCNWTFFSKSRICLKKFFFNSQFFKF